MSDFKEYDFTELKIDFSDEQLHKVAIWTCSNAKDVEEAREFLQMLGFCSYEANCVDFAHQKNRVVERRPKFKVVSKCGR